MNHGALSRFRRAARWEAWAVAALIVTALALDDSQARSSGINGFSGNPATNGGAICNACHSGGQTPQVSLDGPTLVAPGTVHTYTLTIMGGQEVAGGLDVSATSGSLVVTDPGTQLKSGEITHTSPRPVDGNKNVTFSFNWTAPVVEGAAMLYGAGNSVNLASGNGGDRAASDSLAITVASAPAGPGESSGLGAAPLRVTARDPLTGEMTLSYETGCETESNNLYFGPLSLVSNHNWNGEVCDIGTGGELLSFNPGSRSFFFVVVGRKGSDEGSYGTDLQGGAEVERPPFDGNTCGQLQVLTDRCD